MNWSGKNVFITGTDGFIGSHLVESMVELGATVTAFALYNSFDSHGWLDTFPAKTRGTLKLARGDIRDPHQMMALCQGRAVVFHLAALIAIPYSYDAPSSYVKTNVQGTVNVMQTARNAGVSRVINTSTSEVYGTAQTTSISEDHPLQGQSPYSASKIAADRMAESFFRSFDLPIVTLRPFNTYGPRQSERAIISTVMRQIVDDTCTEISVGDLTPKRDFNFVSDTVSAFLAAASLDNKYNGEIFNGGSGRMVTIGDLIEIVRSVTGSDKLVVQEDHRKRPEKSEVMVLLADASKLHAASGWVPSASLEDGLRQTAEWWAARSGSLRQDAGYMV